MFSNKRMIDCTPVGGVQVSPPSQKKKEEINQDCQKTSCEGGGDDRG